MFGLKRKEEGVSISFDLTIESIGFEKSKFSNPLLLVAWKRGRRHSGETGTFEIPSSKVSKIAVLKHISNVKCTLFKKPAKNKKDLDQHYKHKFMDFTLLEGPKSQDRKKFKPVGTAKINLAEHVSIESKSFPVIFSSASKTVAIMDVKISALYLGVTDPADGSQTEMTENPTALILQQQQEQESAAAADIDPTEETDYFDYDSDFDDDFATPEDSPRDEHHEEFERMLLEEIQKQIVEKSATSVSTPRDESEVAHSSTPETPQLSQIQTTEQQKLEAESTTTTKICKEENSAEKEQECHQDSCNPVIQNQRFTQNSSENSVDFQTQPEIIDIEISSLPTTPFSDKNKNENENNRKFDMENLENSEKLFENRNENENQNESVVVSQIIATEENVEIVESEENSFLKKQLKEQIAKVEALTQLASERTLIDVTLTYLEPFQTLKHVSILSNALIHWKCLFFGSNSVFHERLIKSLRLMIQIFSRRPDGDHLRLLPYAPLCSHLLTTALTTSTLDLQLDTIFNRKFETRVGISNSFNRIEIESLKREIAGKNVFVLNAENYPFGDSVQTPSEDSTSSPSSSPTTEIDRSKAKEFAKGLIECFCIVVASSLESVFKVIDTALAYSLFSESDEEEEDSEQEHEPKELLRLLSQFLNQIKTACGEGPNHSPTTTYIFTQLISHLNSILFNSLITKRSTNESFGNSSFCQSVSCGPRTGAKIKTFLFFVELWLDSEKLSGAKTELATIHQALKLFELQNKNSLSDESIRQKVCPLLNATQLRALLSNIYEDTEREERKRMAREAQKAALAFSALRQQSVSAVKGSGVDVSNFFSSLNGKKESKSVKQSVPNSPAQPKLQPQMPSPPPSISPPPPILISLVPFCKQEDVLTLQSHSISIPSVSDLLVNEQDSNVVEMSIDDSVAIFLRSNPNLSFL